METYLNREQSEAQRKAEILIEALPYIQEFNRKIVVVKYGGSAMNDEELQRIASAERPEALVHPATYRNTPI